MIERDIIGFYNSFINIDPSIPVGVCYSKPNKCLVFTQYNFRMDVGILNYYCKNLINIKNTALLPDDIKELLDSLKDLINSGQLSQDRILISPTKYGFEVYRANKMNTGIGPIKLASVKFVTSNGWLFRKIVNWRYKNIIGDIVK